MQLLLFLLYTRSHSSPVEHENLRSKVKLKGKSTKFLKIIFFHNNNNNTPWQHTHNHKIHPLTHILDTRVLIFSCCSLFTACKLWTSVYKLMFTACKLWTSVYKLMFRMPRHIPASLPSPGDNHQSTGGRSERTHCQEKMVLPVLPYLEHLIT